jgi:uncharacterized C2H2 Zn-finger protein
MATEGDELRQAAAAVVGSEGEGDLPCPDCDRKFETRRSLAQHRRQAHVGERRKSGAHDVVTIALESERGPLVENMATVGTGVAMFLPHTGLTVVSRAAVTADALIEVASRDRRLAIAIRRFNQFFKSGELVQVAISLGAAAAVDLGVLDPHLAIEVGPFTGELAIRPVEGLIGDVVAQVEKARRRQGEQQEPGISVPSGPPNGSPPRRAHRRKAPEAPVEETRIEGGVTAT